MFASFWSVKYNIKSVLLYLHGRQGHKNSCLTSLKFCKLISCDLRLLTGTVLVDIGTAISVNYRTPPPLMEQRVSCDVVLTQCYVVLRHSLFYGDNAAQ